MEGPAPARVAALEILRHVRRGRFADHALERVAADLEPSDRRLAQEIAYGVLRLRGALDEALRPLVRGGIERLDPDVLDTLRIGAYQILELDRVPDYAAVSEAVTAARLAAGEGAARLINAVLRRLGRQGATVPEPPADDTVDYFSSWGSHPEWLIRRWVGRFDRAELASLVRYDNARPAVYLRVLGDRDTAVERLKAAGIACQPAGAPGELGGRSIRLESPSVVQVLELVPGVIQDPAASAVVDYADPDPGSVIADLCAAPGGKAALLTAGGNRVWALDLSRVRALFLIEVRKRLSLECLRVVVGDARRPPLASVDAVLLDVPCTGTGTLARNPDARWRLRPSDLDALVAAQRDMLEAAADLVAPGGVLVYSTCSLEPEENEEQVARFLERNRGYTLEAPGPGTVPRECLQDDGSYFVVPGRHGFDGAYAARLRRKA